MRIINILICKTILIVIYGCAITTSELDAGGSAPKEKVDKQENMPPAEPVKPLLVKKGLGISYDDMVNLLDDFIDIKELGSVPGRIKFSGASENKLISLEITGEKGNISEALLSLHYPDNITQADRDLNTAIMIRFLRNSMPEFTEWLSKGEDIYNKFASSEAGSVSQEDMIFKGKIASIVCNKALNIITINVKAAE